MTRLSYRVVQRTVLTEGQVVATDAKELRHLELGETVEALGLEEAKDAKGAQRLRCRAAMDGIEGWATVSVNGTSFLEPCISYYMCVRETILTESLDIMNGNTLRRIV